MTCTQRNHLILVYCLLVLVHVRQTVNTLQDDYYRHLGTHHHYRHNPLPFRDEDDDGDYHQSHSHKHHHHRHQYHHHHQQLQRHSFASNPIRSYKMHQSSDAKYVRQRFENKPIEEAVHAFHSSSTMRPASSYHHYIPKPRVDNREPHKNPLPSIVNHRRLPNIRDFSISDPTTTAITARTASSTSMPSSVGGHRRGRMPVSHKQRSLFNMRHSDMSENRDDQDAVDDNDDDYYYYDGDDDNGNAGEDAGENANAYGNSNDDNDDDDGALQTNRKPSLPTPEDDTMDYEHNFLADDPSEGTGSLTDEKLRNYSTREGVERMRRIYLPETAVVAHIKRVQLEAKCKYPRPKIIPVSQASKRFVPHCTVLHRCSDDTGCCDSDTQTCVAKRNVTVDLHFYVIHLGSREPEIEMLSLINHTECHCVDRYHMMRSTTLSPDAIMENAGREGNQCVKYFDLFAAGDEMDYVRCDCAISNSERRESCERLKKGEEGFSMEDRMCITQRRCLTPTCEYGQYNKGNGRCPRKEDKLEAARQLNMSFHESRSINHK